MPTSLSWDPGVRTLEPAALGEPSVRTQVEQYAGWTPSAATAGTIHAATRGNPGLVAAVVSALPDEPIEIRGSAELAALQLPLGILRRIDERLDQIESSCRSVVEAVAVFGEGADYLDLGSAIALEPSALSNCADRLAGAGILSDDLQLRFLYPILGAAVYQGVPPNRRAELHAEAAALLHGRGAGAAEVGAHLLHTKPLGQPWVVSQLREAARRARSASDPERALRLLRRAGQEPSARRSTALHLDLASSLAEAGEPEAIEVLESLSGQLTDPEARAKAGLELVACLAYEGRIADALDAIDDVLGCEMGEPEGRSTCLLDSQRALFATLSVQGRHRALDALEAAEARVAAEDSEAGSASPTDLAAVALERAVSGDSAASATVLAERAIDGLREADDNAIRTGSRLGVSLALLWSDRPRSSERLLSSLIDDASALGRTRSSCLALALRSQARLRIGRLEEAEADANEHLARSPEGQWIPFRWVAVATMIQCRLLSDDVPGAQITSAMVEVPTAADGILSEPLREAMALLHMTRRDPCAALTELDPCERLELLWGGGGSPVPVPWRLRRGLAMLMMGHAEEAGGLITEELELAREGGYRRVEGAALHALALIETGDERIELLRSGVEVLRATPAPIERAAAEIDLGSELRRNQQMVEAREHLQRALRRSRNCGAAVLSDRATRELEMAGASVAPDEAGDDQELTSAEVRVAGMAAEGMTNLEISKAGFISVKTVEFHLTRVYRKLGISGRQDLPKALSER